MCLAGMSTYHGHVLEIVRNINGCEIGRGTRAKISSYFNAFKIREKIENPEASREVEIWLYFKVCNNSKNAS